MLLRGHSPEIPGWQNPGIYSQKDVEGPRKQESLPGKTRGTSEIPAKGKLQTYPEQIPGKFQEPSNRRTLAGKPRQNPWSSLPIKSRRGTENFVEFPLEVPRTSPRSPGDYPGISRKYHRKLLVISPRGNPYRNSREISGEHLGKILGHSPGVRGKFLTQNVQGQCRAFPGEVP